jgi:hypothetical protein
VLIPNPEMRHAVHERAVVASTSWSIWRQTSALWFIHACRYPDSGSERRRSLLVCTVGPVGNNTRKCLRPDSFDVFHHVHAAVDMILAIPDSHQHPYASIGRRDIVRSADVTRQVSSNVFTSALSIGPHRG